MPHKASFAHEVKLQQKSAKWVLPNKKQKTIKTQQHQNTKVAKEREQNESYYLAQSKKKSLTAYFTIVVKT